MYDFFLESGEFDDIPTKLNKIVDDVSNDVEHLPGLQVGFCTLIDYFNYKN